MRLKKYVNTKRSLIYFKYENFVYLYLLNSTHEYIPSTFFEKAIHVSVKSLDSQSLDGTGLIEIPE